MIDIKDLFEKHDKEFLKFDRIENPPSKRKDLCGFILLDKLLPGKSDIISASEHDEIWIDVDLDNLAEVATEEDIIYLLRCGFRESREFNCLGKFV